MKRYLSIFQLLARSSLYRLLALFLLMGLIQFGLFSNVLSAQVSLRSCNLESAIADARLSWVFTLGALLSFILLAAVGCDLGSRQRYTLRRLPVSEKKLFLCQSVYNSLSYFLLLAAELLITLLLCKLYLAKGDPDLINSQTLMLASYRSPFFHALLPLSDQLLWWRNLLLILSMGIVTALIPYHQRRSRGLFTGQAWQSVVPVFYLFLTVRSFLAVSWASLIFAVGLMLYALIASAFLLLRRMEDET